MRFLTICVAIAGCSWEGSWEGGSWSLSGGAIAAHDLSAKGELSATVPLAGGDWRSTTYITLKAVGDITPGTNFSYYGLPPQPDLLFQAVRPLLAGADLLFGNLETTLTDHPTTIKRVGTGKVFAFRTPPDYAWALQRAGFDVLSIANNHSYDFGEQGYQDTLTHIRAAGMQAMGETGRVTYTKVNELTIAWVGFGYYKGQNNMNDIETAKAFIAKASQNADITIVSVHGGAEGTGATRVRDAVEIFYGEKRGNPIQFARSAIASGADLVLGHGPHVPRAMELYEGRLIAYSLGNFVGYMTLSSEGILGYSLVLEVKLDGRGKFVSGKIHPVRIGRDGIPRPDPQGASIELIRELTQLDLPNTPLTIDETGNLLLPETL